MPASGDGRMASPSAAWSPGLVVPVPAATVVLLRPGRLGLEVLLTRRPSSMAFAADMHVFPGGRVDDADRSLGLQGRSVLSASEAATALADDVEPEHALAAYIAAIRELFEEAGVLLADVGPSAAALATGQRSRARSALIGGEASFASIVAELGLRLRTDWLVPISRWVTPPILPRRFDARFFAAELPPGARVSFEGDEVVAHEWLTPAAGLASMAESRIGMWVPTSATLQQLEHVTSIEQIRERLVPMPIAPIEVDPISSDVTRIVMPAGGGVPGQPVCAYLVGRERLVLVDPGDPTGPALERALATAAAQGGSIVGVALTQVDPDHAASAEGIALMLNVPIVTGPGGRWPLPYPVQEVADGAVVPFGDVRLEAIATPGPGREHLAFLVGERPDLVLSGDLDGRRGARMIPRPWDETAAAASREIVRQRAPGATWHPGHPTTARVGDPSPGPT
jgi:glyoxylase-like metal-dependent hydrolase (beta-lactamase superfamily II)/8-oxo-dGTP pyrophosphatase MutT (NUDIX family)